MDKKLDKPVNELDALERAVAARLADSVSYSNWAPVPTGRGRESDWDVWNLGSGAPSELDSDHK